MRNLTTKYVRSITPDRKAIMEEKVLASAIFRQKKKGYEESIAKPFVTKREGSSINYHSVEIFCFNCIFTSIENYEVFTLLSRIS